MNSARLPAGRSLLTTSTSGMRATPATGAMLFAKSNGSDGSNEALIAFAVEVSSSVCPSGGEAITAWVPILLPAPGLFSTTKGWPSRSQRRWQIKRDNTSVAPPEASGTTHSAGCDGYARSAWADGIILTPASARLAPAAERNKALRSIIATFKFSQVLCLTRFPCADRCPSEKRFVVTAGVLQESGQAARHSGHLGKIRVPGQNGRYSAACLISSTGGSESSGRFVCVQRDSAFERLSR